MTEQLRRGPVRAAWKFIFISFVVILVQLQLDASNIVLSEEEEELKWTSSEAALFPSEASSNQDDIPIATHLSKKLLSQKDITANLIVHVRSWREGMAGWRKSLANIQVFAKQLNATLVEPDILNGRLVAANGNIRLFELMDPTKWDADVKWIQLEDLERILPQEASTVEIHLCLNICDPTMFANNACAPRKAPLSCPVGNETISSDYRKRKSPRLQQALDLVAAGETVLLKIHEFWKDGLSQMRVLPPQRHLPTNKNNEVLNVHNGSEADRLRAQLEFQPRLYALAQKALQKLGIPSGHPFHAIHWRAELAKMNYTECVQRILHSQQQMTLSSPSTETKFLLLSSLSTNRSRIWRQDEIYVDDSQIALDMLLKGESNNAFLKVDQVYDYLGLRDPIESAAIDLILAEKSSQFATCTSDCGRNCLQCNHAGFFALLAIGMRSKHQKESHACWPKKKKKALE